MFTMLRATVNGKRPHFLGDLLTAGTVATLFSGLPSTFWSLWSGADPWQALRAAGAMLVPADAAFPLLVTAASMVHCAISFLWASLLILILPPRHIMFSAPASAALIGVLDLRIIGRLFNGVYALPFWPQMADHLLWGALLGVVLHVRARGRQDQDNGTV